MDPGDSTGAAAAIAEAAVRRGPTQVNLQFAEPLLPDPSSELSEEAWDAEVRARRRPRWSSRSEEAEVLPPGPRTVVVAGDDAGPPARFLAQDGNWPLLAEPTSGARTGTHALRTSRLLLAGELGHQIERVVVTGHPTLSRPVTQLISSPDLEVISVAGPTGVATDPGRVARHLGLMPVPAGADDDDWVDAWRTADAALARGVDEVAATADGLPLRVAAAVAEAVVARGLLVVGSSQPVRDLDLMTPAYPDGERRLIVGNRGLAGIDGTVSTAIGAALGRTSTRSLAYVGDLTFLHDTNGLVIGPGEPRPDLTFVVANDDGGAIFSTLEQGGPEHAGAFERVFGTPHGVDLGKLCAATGTAYEQVTDVDRLRAALAEDVRGNPRAARCRCRGRAVAPSTPPFVPSTDATTVVRKNDQEPAPGSRHSGRHEESGMSSGDGYLRLLRGHARRPPRRPRGDRRTARRAGLPVALPLRPGRGRHCGGDTGADSGGACCSSGRRTGCDDAVQRPRHRGRSGLLPQRGVHACVPAGIRRRTGGLAQAAAPQHAARRRPTAFTSIPLAAFGCLLERR